MAIPCPNIFAMAIWDPTAKFNLIPTNISNYTVYMHVHCLHSNT